MRISDWSSDVCSSDLHLHIFSVGHVWEIDRYPAIAGRIGSARFFNEHLAVNIVCCPVLIPEHMGAPFALLRASPIIGLAPFTRSEEHTSELQSLMRTSYAVLCMKKNTENITCLHNTTK